MDMTWHSWGTFGRVHMEKPPSKQTSGADVSICWGR